MKYIKPHSVTWWTGTVMIAAGAISAAAAGFPEFDAMAAIVEAVYPGVSAGGLFTAGFALWGIRAAPGVNGS